VEQHPARSTAGPDALFTLDAQGSVVGTNASLRALLGYGPEEGSGAPFRDYVAPCDGGKAAEVWGELAAGRAVREVRLRLRKRAGDPVEAVCNAVPCVDGEGRLVGAQGAFRPVAAQDDWLGQRGGLLAQIARLCEADASQSPPEGLSQALRALVAHPSRLGAEACWIGLIDEDTGALRPIVHSGEHGCLLATAAAGDLRVPGPVARAVVSRQAAVVDPVEGGPPPTPLVEEAHTRGYRSLAVFPMVYGEQVVGALVAYSRQTGFFDEGKVFLLELVAMVGATAVASARASESARQSDAQFSNLVETLPCVVYIARPTIPPQILFITSNVEQFLGYTPDDFYADGGIAFRVIHPEDRERAAKRVREAVTRPEPYTLRYRAVHRNGKDIYHATLRSTPLLDASGRVVLRQGIIMDVTEQARLERELLQSQRLAAIGELAAMMAHEVRNPLAGMALALRVLRSLLPGSPPAHECLADLEGGLQRVNATVTRVLDFSKDRPLQPRRCSLAEIVEAARRLTATYVRKNRIELSVELAEGLPELYADPAQLEQVFVNLILNACKAMPDGGRLSLRAQASAGHLVAEVADTGVGVSPEHIEDIFNPFYSGFGDGTGLGLPLSQRIVAAHGGTLRVESAPGQGSTFRVELPLEPPDAAHPSH